MDVRLDALMRVDPESGNLLRAASAAGGRIPFGGNGLAETLTSEWIQRDGETESLDVVVVPGSSAALDLQTLLQKLPQKTKVFWMEVDSARVFSMFLRCPLESHVESGRLCLALGRDESLGVARFRKMWTLSQAPRFKIFDQAGVSPADNTYYNTVLRAICKTVTLDVFNMGTLICRGGLWQMNTLTNLPILLRNPGVRSLRQAFPGKPALVVGAGPSLNGALPYLKQCAGEFVVISTGTALRALRKAGIRPDLVVAVDAHPLMASQFEVACDDLYLACSTLLYPPALRKFKGVFSGTLEANPIDRWLDEVTTDRGGLLAAGTVTSTAIDLAVQMGCNPILAVGFDLSLASDGTTHAANTMYHGVRVDTAYPDLVWVPGNHAEKVPTTPQFRNYITLIEKYVARHPEQAFINVTDAGARIAGMTVVPTADLGRYTQGALGAAGLIEARYEADRVDYRSSVAGALNEHLAQLESMVGTAKQAAQICNQLLMVMRDTHPDSVGELQKLADELEASDAAIGKFQASSFLIEMSLWPAIYWLETRKEAYEKSYPEAVFMYKRWRQFYQQIAGASMWTRDLLAGILKEMNVRESGCCLKVEV